MILVWLICWPILEKVIKHSIILLFFIRWSFMPQVLIEQHLRPLSFVTLTSNGKAILIILDLFLLLFQLLLDKILILLLYLTPINGLNYFGLSKITYLNMIFRIQQNVLRLQISVNDLL